MGRRRKRVASGAPGDGRLSLEQGKGRKLPFARGEQQAAAPAFGERCREALFVQFGKALAQLLYLALQSGDSRFGQHAVGKHHRLVVLHEGATQKIGEPFVVEETPDRSVRKPVEVPGDVVADTVARKQVDQPQPVEASEALHAFGLRQRVARADIVLRPLVEDAYGHQQELHVGHQFPLLCRRQCVQPFFGQGRFLRQFGQREAEKVGDRHQIFGGYAAAGEAAFDRRFGNAHQSGDVAVGGALRAQPLLERPENVVEFGHWRSGIVFRYQELYAAQLFMRWFRSVEP